MVGSNKILTVSYGTFSCTLEGFDDSFHSMKAIAEYFRDLAQEDRYFGAEPPTPDAEMLARIAEREISRRVEAEMKNGSVRLRAHALDDAPAKETPAAAETEIETTNQSDTAVSEQEPVAEAAPVQTEEATPEVVMPPVAAKPAVDEDAAEAFMATPNKTPDLVVPPAPALSFDDAPAHPDENSVAAKLQRIRAVVGKAAMTAAVDVEDAEISTPMSFHDESVADVVTANPEEAVAHDETTVAVADVEAADSTDNMEDPIASDADHAETAVEEIKADTVAMAEEADTNDVMADDPLGEDAVTETATTEEVEDEVVEEIALDAEEPVEASDAINTDDTFDSENADISEDTLVTEDANWALEALSDDVPAEEETFAFAESDVLDADDSDLSFDLNDIDVPVAAEQTERPEDVAADEDEIVAQADDAEEESASHHVTEEVVAADDAAAPDLTEKGEIAEDAKGDAKGPSIDLAAIEVADAEVGTSLKQRIHARIVRLRKDGLSRAIPVANADDDAAIEGIKASLKPVAETPASQPPLPDTFGETANLPQTVDAEEKQHDDIRSAIAAAMPAGSLSDEDEDDLQRELAAAVEDVVVLEDDTPEPHKEVVIEENATKPETVEADAPVMPEVVQSRPRKRLPEPDYAVTRMIAQTDEALNEPAGSRRRNAIAQLKAAVAATEAARQLGDKSDSAAEAQSAFRDDLDQVVRPSRTIEAENAQQAERPRAAPLKLVASQRVDGVEDQASRPMTKPADAADAGGFAKFAAAMGATELPDLLEAAAAYTSFVEGIEDFSRPQIMKKVQMTTNEEFSREDGLRSFGTLLRQGRISKVRNGRFQVSEQTRFRPDARSA